MIGAIPFIIMLIITTIIFFLSKKENYLKEIEEVDKSEYGLKDILYMGLFMVDILKEENLKKVNRKIYNSFISMYGTEARDNFRYYLANKLLISLFAGDGVCFIGAAMGEFNLMVTIAGFLAPIATYFLMDSTLNEKMAIKQKKIKYEFPDFLSKLTLLINAGLTFESAWEKIIDNNKSDEPLYFEFKRTLRDIKANIPRDKCLSDLSRKCKINEITKFCTIVIQNINRGTNDMTNMLSNLADECWLERKSMARQKGEEAGSKLLFPMMLMLLSIFLVVLVPAFLQMVTM